MSFNLKLETNDIDLAADIVTLMESNHPVQKVNPWTMEENEQLLTQVILDRTLAYYKLTEERTTLQSLYEKIAGDLVRGVPAVASQQQSLLRSYMDGVASDEMKAMIDTIKDKIKQRVGKVIPDDKLLNTKRTTIIHPQSIPSTQTNKKKKMKKGDEYDMSTEEFVHLDPGEQKKERAWRAMKRSGIIEPLVFSEESNEKEKKKRMKKKKRTGKPTHLPVFDSAFRCAYHKRIHKRCVWNCAWRTQQPEEKVEEEKEEMKEESVSSSSMSNLSNDPLFQFVLRADFDVNDPKQQQLKQMVVAELARKVVL